MNDVQKLSFKELSRRELLKGWVWWVGLVSAVSTAVYLYGQANPK